MSGESDSPKLPFDQFLPRERSPFSPSGEKVADRPDEGLCWISSGFLKNQVFPGSVLSTLKPRVQFDRVSVPIDRANGKDTLFRIPYDGRSC